MAFVCNNICERYRQGVSAHKYLAGHKRCTNCEVFINYDGLRCPCCNTKLRTRSRSKPSKKRGVLDGVAV